jgi:curved DNA-binding protein CbpA
MASEHVDVEEDLYVILGLNDGGAHVTQASIRKAYHKRALQIHPDKSKNEPLVATEEFKKLQKAYETLSDKEARGAYDKLQQTKKENEERERQKKMKHKNEMHDPLAMLQDPIIKKRIHEHNLKWGFGKPRCKYMNPPRYHPGSKTLFTVHWNCTPDHFT